MRRLKRAFKRPRTPWNAAQIAEERKLLAAYGLRRKKELWRAKTILRRYRQRARVLTAQHDPVAEKILMERLTRLGILQKQTGAPTADDVLALTIETLLDRRLQTIMVKRGMAKTMTQARQFITHGHVSVGERKVFYPSYLVLKEEESRVVWAGKPVYVVEVKQKLVKGEAKGEAKREVIETAKAPMEAVAPA